LEIQFYSYWSTTTHVLDVLKLGKKKEKRKKTENRLIKRKGKFFFVRLYSPFVGPWPPFQLS
jgi:hypothetical protein